MREQSSVCVALSAALVGDLQPQRKQSRGAGRRRRRGLAFSSSQLALSFFPFPSFSFSPSPSFRRPCHDAPCRRARRGCAHCSARAVKAHMPSPTHRRHGEAGRLYGHVVRRRPALALSLASPPCVHCAHPPCNWPANAGTRLPTALPSARYVGRGEKRRVRQAGRAPTAHADTPRNHTAVRAGSQVHARAVHAEGRPHCRGELHGLQA